MAVNLNSLKKKWQINHLKRRLKEKKPLSIKNLLSQTFQKKKIEELNGNLDQEKEKKYLRLFAEFENFKKRTAKERIELFKTAGQEVISAILPILDDMERAINQTPEEEKKSVEGFVLINNKLVDVSKREWIECY